MLGEIFSNNFLGPWIFAITHDVHDSMDDCKKVRQLQGTSGYKAVMDWILYCNSTYYLLID